MNTLASYWNRVCFQLFAALLLALALSTPSWAEPVIFGAVLPGSRSVQVGTTATVFATILNSGNMTAIGCEIALLSSFPAIFSYQTTDSTNTSIGAPNTPVDIPGGEFQTFVISIAPTAPLDPTEVILDFFCANATSAPSTTGVNTVLLSATPLARPDIIKLAATPTNDGIVHIPGTTGTGIFALASINIGSEGTLTLSADTGNVSVPLELTLCQTNTATGACLATPSTIVTTLMTGGAIASFAVFAKANGPISLDPAVNRIFIRCKDASGVTRGLTSVAVVTTSGTSVVDISGLWFAEETVKATCSLEGVGEEFFEESGSGTITITQNGDQVSYLPPGLPPDGIRTGIITGNMVAFSGKFVIAVPGVQINFTENLVTIQGTIGQNRIDLTGAGIARGTVVGFGPGECMGTSTAVLTR